MPGEKKISSSPFPTPSNFCFRLHPSLLKWFPVTNRSNCQNQTLRPGTPQAETASSLPAVTLNWPGPTDLCGHHRSPPPSSGASRLSSGFPGQHPWYSRFIVYFRLGKTNPLHFIAFIGCLLGLISHFSVSPILRPFAHGVGSLL